MTYSMLLVVAAVVLLICSVVKRDDDTTLDKVLRRIATVAAVYIGTVAILRTVAVMW